MKYFLKSLVLTLASAALAGDLASAAPASPAPAAKPTIVLVHGAFADASSWNRVVSILQHDGYQAMAVANPLRSVKDDSAYVRALLVTMKTPVVLVGHSYGGMVISNAATGLPNVKALVFVAAFAPEAGENAGVSTTNIRAACSEWRCCHPCRFPAAATISTSSRTNSTMLSRRICRPPMRR
jgi:pimeloyl-ACP methyl ester carboxylesterase